MILESLVTTLSAEGAWNLAPMGPTVEEGDDVWSRFVLRPYRSSTTYRNLKETGEGVLHVSDDVLLFARSAIGRVDRSEVRTRRANEVNGLILEETCRYYEFRVDRLDDREERTTIVARTVATGRIRDFFGFNRGKHAVIEAAILATRLDFLPLDEIRSELNRLEILVQKTGGVREHEAFTLLKTHVGLVGVGSCPSEAGTP